MNSSENKLFFPLPHIKSTDIPDKGCLININEKNVAIFKYKNEIFGLQDSCPHTGGPLHLGDIEMLPDKSVCVRCPWHGWKFDVRTGEIKFPVTRKDLSPIKTYPIQVDRNDKILIGFDEINKKYFSSTDF